MNASTKRDSVAKMMKAWESKNARRALQGAGLSTMAVTLAACGGSSTTPTATPDTTPVAPTAQALTLQIGQDSITAGAGADTITGIIAQNNNGALTQQIDVTDVIDGAGGSDTLVLTMNADAGAPVIRNVETVSIRSTNDAADLNLTNSDTSITAFIVRDSATDLLIDAVQSSASLTVRDSASDVDLNYAADVLDSDEAAQTLNVDNASGSVAYGVAGDDAITTLTIAASGDESDLTLTLNSLETLTVSGAAALELTAGGNFNALTSITSTNTAGLTIATGNVAEATNPGTVDIVDITVTTGSGADAVNMNGTSAALEISVNLGAGNDTFTVDEAGLDAAGATTAGDSINGGDGTDTYVLAAAMTLDADFSEVVTGFEVVEMTVNGAFGNLDELAANAYSVRVTDADAANNTAVTVAMTGMATGATVTLQSETVAGATLLTQSAAVGGVADNDGVAVSFALQTDDTTTAAADTITINALAGYESIGDGGTNDFEVVNLNYTGAAAATIDALAFGAAEILRIVSAQDLTLTTVTTAADADITATGSSGDITASFAATIDSYAGGTGDDDITLANDAALNSTNTFAGGAGNDTLTVVNLAVNAGIVNVTGFETLEIDADGAGGQLDLRSSTGITTIVVSTDAALVAGAGDDLTISRIASGVVVEIASDFDLLTLTTQSGTAQTVSITAAGEVDLLTIDGGTETLNIISDDGNDTEAEAVGDINAIAGAGLETIVVTGDDDLDLDGVSVATVTTFNASAANGNITYTSANATEATITGGSEDDTLTGGAGDDTITGGDGNDILDGDGGDDVYVFAATGAANGTDTITFVVGEDDLNVAAMGTFTVEQNGALGTAINEFSSAATSDVNITGKIVLLNDATPANVDGFGDIAALIDTANNVFSITAGGKAIVIAGDAGAPAANEVAHMYFVHDANGDGDVADADEVMKIATLDDGVGATSFDLDTLTTANFILA